MLGDQREVYAYWRDLCRDGHPPARSDFRPAGIVRRLPLVSMVEISDCARRFRCRLAGTGLREMLGEELTGRFVGDLGFGDDTGFAREVYDGVAASGEPAQGYSRFAWRDRPAMVQAWLRLPLAGSDGRVSTILGYDRFLPMERLTARPRAEARNGHFAVAI